LATALPVYHLVVMWIGYCNKGRQVQMPRFTLSDVIFSGLSSSPNRNVLGFYFFKVYYIPVCGVIRTVLHNSRCLRWQRSAESGNTVHCSWR